MVKGAENTISDTSALNSRRYEIFEVSPLTVVETVKRSKELRTPFVTLVH